MPLTSTRPTSRNSAIILRMQSLFLTKPSRRTAHHPSHGLFGSIQQTSYGAFGGTHGLGDLGQVLLLQVIPLDGLALFAGQRSHTKLDRLFGLFCRQAFTGRSDVGIIQIVEQPNTRTVWRISAQARPPRFSRDRSRKKVASWLSVTRLSQASKGTPRSS